MRLRVAAASLVVLSSGTFAYGHRLDEYLQATTISLEKGRIQVDVHLTPGVAVFPSVMATIDTNHDGAISKTEERVYVQRVQADLSLLINGERLALRLISARFPGVEQMQEGLGDMQLDFAADVPDLGRERTLVFENHHQSPIASYLVNCLVPGDPDIRIAGQNRNYEQSSYELEFLQEGFHGPLSLGWWRGSPAWIGSLTILLVARLTGLWWHQRRALLRAELADQLQERL